MKRMQCTNGTIESGLDNGWLLGFKFGRPMCSSDETLATIYTDVEAEHARRYLVEKGYHVRIEDVYAIVAA